MKTCVWDVSLEDGTRTFARIMARELNATVVRGRARHGHVTQLIDELDAYDLVLMSSVQWHLMDRRDELNAWHVQVARALPDKLVPALHNPLDPTRRNWANSRHAELVMSLTRRAWTCDLNHLAGSKIDHNKIIETHNLPYYPYCEPVDWDEDAAETLLSTTRIARSKQVLLPIEAGYRGSYVLAGRSHYNLARQLRAKLINRYVFTPLDEPSTNRWQAPWTVTRPDASVHYLGPYGGSGAVPFHVAQTHFAATLDGYVDYVTLEAMSAGLRCVVPHDATRGLGYLTVLTYANLSDLPRMIARAMMIGPPEPTRVLRDLKRHHPSYLADVLRTPTRVT